jgi:hypothetical protein
MFLSRQQSDARGAAENGGVLGEAEIDSGGRGGGERYFSRFGAFR